MSKKKTKRRLRIFGILLSKEDSKKVRRNAKNNGLSLKKYVEKKSKNFISNHYVGDKLKVVEKEKRTKHSKDLSKESLQYVEKLAEKSGLTIDQYFEKWGGKDKIKAAILKRYTNPEMPFHVKHAVDEFEATGYRFIIDCERVSFANFNMFLSMFYITYGDEIYLDKMVPFFEFKQYHILKLVKLENFYLSDSSNGQKILKYSDNCEPNA